MELKKTSENKNRNYDENGNISNYNESENYSLRENGTEIASVSVNVDNYGGGSASINLAGFSTIEEGVGKVMELLGIV